MPRVVLAIRAARQAVKCFALLLLLLPALDALARTEGYVQEIGRERPRHALPNTTLEEVLVTARKKEENSQRVPISLFSLSGSQIDARNTSSAQNILQGVGNVSMEVLTPRQSSLAIRGLGKNPANDGLESSVGVFLDGVYLGRPGMLVTDLVDIERIEILRGPQGTLFGKNVTAGALNISTRAPGDGSNGYVQVTLGSDGLVQAKGAVSGPLGVINAAYRLTAFNTSRNGFTEAVVTGRDLGELDRSGVRGQLQWRRADGMRLRVIADYSSQDEDGPGLVLVDSGALLADGTIRENNFLDRTRRAGHVPEFNPSARRTYADAEQRLRGEQAGLSVQADWSWFDHDLTSISAWRTWNFRPHVDGDLTPLDVQPDLGFAVKHRQVSQELRLASKGHSRLEYLLGAYLYGQRLTGTFASQYGVDAADFAIPGLSPKVLDGVSVQTIGTPRIESYAMFAHATWQASPRLVLAGGLRWTMERKRADITRRSVGGVPLAVSDTVGRALREQLGAASHMHVALSEDFLSGELSVSYDFADSVLGYTSVSRGAKSGGINSAVVPSGIDQVLDPEIATNYELGLKSEWLDRRVRFNAAVYWTELTGYQATVRDPVRAATFLANAGTVRSRGAELEGVWQATAALQFELVAGWNEAVFTSFRNATCPPEISGRTACDVTGMRVPGAPPWTVSTNVVYQRPVLDGQLTVYAGGELVHAGAYRAELSSQTRIEAHTLVHASVGIRSRDERWDVWLWSRNLLDEDYFTFLSNAGLFHVGALYGELGDPRSFGVSLRMAY